MIRVAGYCRVSPEKEDRVNSIGFTIPLRLSATFCGQAHFAFSEKIF